jgi:uncharacterized protein involved in outer membrane biogenesis
MRAFRNILLSATAFIALLVVAALTADLGVLRPLYEQIGSHLLKREVRILGPLEVRLGRHLEVSAQDLTISGAAPNGDLFLSVGAASLALQLTTLLDNEITIKSAALRDVTLNLDTRHDSDDNPNTELIEFAPTTCRSITPISSGVTT